MILFAVTFSTRPQDTPFGAALRETGHPFRLIGADIRLNYRSRMAILLRAYPSLAWFALRIGWAALAADQPGPAVIAVGSDVEVLVLAALRWLRHPFGGGPAIALLGFIYTERPQRWVNRLRQAYFALVLRGADAITCHSRLEIARYRAMFPQAAGRFHFVLWGGHVAEAPQSSSAAPAMAAGPGRCRVVTAGRSGRDYPCFARAIAMLDVDGEIICDSNAALQGVSPSARLAIHRDLYWDDYLARLRAADIIAIPLAVADISAGQMVLTQAMACAKPLIITASPAIADYVTPEENAILVPLGDAAALAAAIARLRDDPALRARMGAAARATYDRYFSQTAHTAATVAVLAQLHRA